MPTRAAAAGVLKHQLMWVWNSQFCVTVFHVAHGVEPTQAMVDADRGVLTNWATNTWKPIASNQCALRQIKTWSMHVSPPAKFANLDLYPNSTITGSSNQPMLPMCMTVAVSLRTGAVGEMP